MLKRNWIFFSLSELFIIFFAFMLIDLNYTQNVIESFLGLLTLIHILIYFFVLVSNKLHCFTVGNLFIYSLYLFNLGLPLSRLFGWISTTDAKRFMDRRIYSMGNGVFNVYMLYSIMIISFLEIGYLFYTMKNKKNNIRYNIGTKSVDNDLKASIDFYNKLKVTGKCGVILITIGILPYIYTEYIYIMSSLIYGYQNDDNPYNLSGTGLGLLSNLVIVGIIMLAVSFQNNKRKFDALLVVVFAYQTLRMLITGDRSTGVAIIVVWILMRHKFIKRIQGRQFLVFSLLLLFAAYFLKIIELTRSYGSIGLQEALDEVIGNNIIATTIFEYGGNVWSGMMVMFSVPATASFRLGLTYIAAIIGKPLLILRITNKIWEFADFSFFLQESERGALINSLTAAMGGSFTGELWFNFGWLSIAICPFLGFFLGWFSKKCFSNEDPFYSSFLIYLSTLVLWWPRQYFTSVSWYALVNGVVFWLIRTTIYKREIKRLYRNM